MDRIPGAAAGQEGEDAVHGGAEVVQRLGRERSDPGVQNALELLAHPGSASACATATGREEAHLEHVVT